jgi:predicted nucleic acid-binding protein
MAVLDASILIEILGKSELGERLLMRIAMERHLFAPEFFYLEVLNGVRRLKQKQLLEYWEADRASAQLQRLAFTIYPIQPLLPRIWELHENITCYDAAYVALAESLHEPLLTLDGRLSRSCGHEANIEYLGLTAQTA